MQNEYIRVFKAFSDKNRMKIIRILSSGEQCACVLLRDLEISQPTLSHHMKILCASGIVKSRRVGPWNYYSIDSEGCRHARSLIKAVEDGKLSAPLAICRAVERILSTLRIDRKIKTNGRRIKWVNAE